jgi:hypothetical protein
MTDCVPENGQSSGKPYRVLILGGGPYMGTVSVPQSAGIV